MIRAIAALVGLSIVAAAPAAAEPVYDKPVATKKARTKKYETACIYFADFMVKQRTPLQGEGGPETPALVRAKDAPCSEAKAPGETALKATDDNSATAFGGRKGGFLIFEGSLEQNRDFAIVDAGSGKLLFADTSGFGLRVETVDLDNGALKIGYRRDITPGEACSLMAKTRDCWARVIADKKLPAGAPAQPPSAQICAAAYKEAGAKPAQDSRLELPVTARIEAGRMVEVKATGPVICAPF